MSLIRLSKPVLSVLALLCVLVVPSVQAEVPTKMSYTGRLTDDTGAPLSGSYDITFRLYTVETLGTAVWTEPRIGVSVSGGVFTVELGSVTPLDPADFAEPLYLGVTVGTDDEMSPRLAVSSAGYAFKPSSYAKVAIVAKGGGDYTSPLDAMANVSSGDNWCGTPSATNRCLVQIMPGVYDIGSTGIVMQQYVSIRGSGQETTKITGGVSTSAFGPESAVVTGADDVDLSDLTIENTGGSSKSIGVWNNTTSPTMTHLTVTGSGGSYNYGVYNTSSSSPTMTDVTVVASGGSYNYGVFNQSSSPTMTDVTATGSGGTDSYGVVNFASSPTMNNVTATGSGGTNSYGVYNTSSSSPTMNNVIASASGASGTNQGISGGTPVLNNVVADDNGTRTVYFDTPLALANAGSLYAKVAVVAKGGGDYTSPTDAMANVSSGDNWCGTPSATNRCQVQIMPGVYDIGSTGIVMQQYVSMRGSGEETTKITGAVSSGTADATSAVISGATDVDLSDLTIENTGGSTNSIGVYNNAVSPTMIHVTAAATGGTTFNFGVYNNSASPSMSSMKADASGGTNNIGVWNTNSSSPTMISVTATGSGGTTSYGVYNSSGSPAMTNVVATASGASSTNQGISAGTPVLNNVLADDNGTRTVYFDAANVAIDDTSVSFTTTDMTVQSTNGMGLNETTPLAGKGLHITNIDKSLPDTAVSNDDLIIEDADSILGLYSDDGGDNGSGVALGEVVGGALVSKWTMYRRTNGGGNGLYFSYGIDAGYASNTAQVKFSTDGKAYKDNNLTTWETTSDAAVKQEVQPVSGALDTLMKVRPVTFRYTDEYRSAHPGLGDGRHYSVIAQEFAEVFPDAVSESGERLESEDRALYQVNIHPALITAMAAIQELNGKLESENMRISAENDRIKAENTELKVATAEIISRLEKLEAMQ
ncbi:tail fiber domain-containing protein [Pseudomonadota bacterium]